MFQESRGTILIVDDDKEFLQETKEMLTTGGYDIEVASDGAMALKKAILFKPVIILLDLKMSPKSGFQVADELRNSLGIKEPAIIAMTGFFTQEKHALIMRLCGIDQCIVKPIKPLELISKIEFALGKEHR